MPIEFILVLAAVTGIAVVTSGAVRRSALRRGRLDVPNARSSHTTPVPRGGGVGIVLAAVAGWTAFHLLGEVARATYLALLGGGLAIALVGFIDDLRPLSSRIRLCVHLAAGIWAIAWLGAFALPLTGHALADLWIGRVFTLFAIVWALNLFNFMDGIDGLAGAQATFVGLGAAVISLAAARGFGAAAAPLVLAAASVGFLCWNWPPAKLFMGDVGSGFLGYALAVLALDASRGAANAVAVWLILGGYFFVDATLTLIRRLLRRERFDQAHRDHAYQWLSRRWGGHLPVTASVAVLNLLFLAPMAWLAMTRPQWAWTLCGLVLTVLGVICLAAGAGRRET